MSKSTLTTYPAESEIAVGVGAELVAVTAPFEDYNFLLQSAQHIPL